MIISTVRGMRDYIGSNAEVYYTISDIFRILVSRYGYTMINTPILEKQDLFTLALGTTSDVVSKEMYSFNDKNGESLVLRPEGTASVVRSFVENSLHLKAQNKFAYFGPMFRYERPQKGRYRQFHQFGVEYFADDTYISDAETIFLANEFLNLLKIKGEITLEISSLGDAESREIYRKILVQYFEKNKNSLSEISLERLEKNPLRILDSKEEQDQEIIKNAPKIIDCLNNESKAFFDGVISSLGVLNVKYKINPYIVRGLDYYNHTVFEFKTDLIESQSTILAGGRYNGFVKLFGGPDIPGIGWAAGFERLVLISNIDIAYEKPTIILTDNEIYGLKVCSDLRSSGIKSEILSGNSFKKLMLKAMKKDPKFIIFIGEEERNSGKFNVKNINTSEQVSLSSIQDIINLVR